jgi:hypothetical protein
MAEARMEAYGTVTGFEIILAIILFSLRGKEHQGILE